MEIWLQMRLLMTSFDFVERDCARRLRLAEGDVFLLMIMGTNPPIRGTEIAMMMGRDRQQVQKTLLALERKWIVEPAELSELNRVRSWQLTDRGRRVIAALSQLIRLWEIDLARMADLDLVYKALDRSCAALVNAPLHPKGWGYALSTPQSLQRMTPEAHAALGALEEIREELHGGTPNDAADRRKIARAEAEKQHKEAVEQRVEDYWDLMMRN